MTSPIHHSEHGDNLSILFVIMSIDEGLVEPTRGRQNDKQRISIFQVYIDNLFSVAINLC